MSYKCGLCNGQVAKGNQEIKLVTKIRKVTFRNSDTRCPDKTAEAVETVEELRVCPDCSKKHGEGFTPQVVAAVTKDVWMTRRKKTEEEMKRRHSFRDDDYR